MHELLSTLTKGFTFSGDIPQDAAAFLIYHDCPNTAIHCRQVAEQVMGLAEEFGVDPIQASHAGWLHDISAVFPNRVRLEVSRQLGIEVLAEEAEVPLLLHQKLSVVIARELFGLRDEAVLDAIECHTTLRAGPSQLDLLLFVADKLAWDQKGEPPYAGKLQAALGNSLEEAAWEYQDYLLHSGKIKIVHPWMRDSYEELKEKFAG